MVYELAQGVGGMNLESGCGHPTENHLTNLQKYFSWFLESEISLPRTYYTNMDQHPNHTLDRCFPGYLALGLDSQVHPFNTLKHILLKYVNAPITCPVTIPQRQSEKETESHRIVLTAVVGLQVPLIGLVPDG